MAFYAMRKKHRFFIRYIQYICHKLLNNFLWLVFLQSLNVFKKRKKHIIIFKSEGMRNQAAIAETIVFFHTHKKKHFISTILFKVL